MNTPIFTIAQGARLYDLQINPAQVPIRQYEQGVIQVVVVEDTDICFYHISPQGDVLLEKLNDSGDGWEAFTLQPETMTWTPLDEDVD